MDQGDEFGVDIESGRSERKDGGLVNVKDRASLCGSLVNSDVDLVESVVIDMRMEDLDSTEKEVLKKKCAKIDNKKAPKPPRAPRGPSLDAADEKLIREIAELAMLKRIRTERVKALKKMKAAKSSSSTSNSLFAMIFTIVFCLVILLQGFTTRSDSSPIIDGSPNSSTPESDLILVQYAHIASAADSRSPSLVELASGQDINEGSKSLA